MTIRTRIWRPGHGPGEVFIWRADDASDAADAQRRIIEALRLGRSVLSSPVLE